MTTPNPTSGAVAPRRLVRAAALADVPPGAVVAAAVEGHAVALVNHDGTIYAVAGDCPHAAGPLGDGDLTEGCLLQCPWHGAVFDVRSGAVRRGPARKPLRTYRVEVQRGDVFVALDGTAESEP